MFRDEQIAYVVLCIAAVVFYFFVIPLQIQESELVEVSPRLIPQICLIGIFFLSILKLLTSFKISKSEFLISFKQYRLLGLALLTLIVGTTAIKWLGFWVSGGLIIAGAMLLCGIRSPLRIGLFTVILTSVTWFFMDLVGLYVV